jgi:hypothetical protein
MFLLEMFKLEMFELEMFELEMFELETFKFKVKNNCKIITYKSDMSPLTRVTNSTNNIKTITNIDR